MTQSTPHAERYDLAELLRDEEHVRIWRAVETSVNAPCYFHQVMLPFASVEHEKQLATAILRNFSLLKVPRLPRLVDGWVDDETVCAVEFKWEADPLSLQDRNPLAGATGRHQRDVFERTLFHLSKLHSNNIIHGRVRADIFGIDLREKVYMIDSGLDRALVRTLYESDATIALATSLQARDLADWAYALLSLSLGEELVASPDDDNWDETDFREVFDRLRTHFRSENLAGFFIDCLSDYGIGDNVYESATDAFGYWRSNGVGDLFR